MGQEIGRKLYGIPQESWLQWGGLTADHDEQNVMHPGLRIAPLYVDLEYL